jgi:hypothetical protein
MHDSLAMTFSLPQTPFRSRQAADFGLSRYALRRLVANGLVRRVLTDVYVAADIPDSIESRVAAAALVTQPYAVLCDRTAAWMHGIDALAYRELEILPPLEIFVIRDYVPRRRIGVNGGQRDLDPLDVMSLEPGILVTTPLRTALDLGCRLSRPLALATMDQFARQHRVAIADLHAELPRYRRRRGVVQLRQLSQLVDGRAESPGESWVRLAVNDAGLPPPLPQFSLRVGGREYTGSIWHIPIIVCASSTTASCITPHLSRRRPTRLAGRGLVRTAGRSSS